MYTKILVPLDGSKTAEHVLPFVRCLARYLRLPVELISAVDLAEMVREISTAKGLFLDTLFDDESRRRGNYLRQVAKNFPVNTAQCAVRKGKAAEVIVESAAAENQTLIAMATHGRSGLNRWLLGSVAEKVLRSASSPMLLIRATDSAPRWDMPLLKRVIVPLDGSQLAESVLPSVEELAKHLDLDVVLVRVYGVPYGAYSAGEGFYDSTHFEAFTAELKDETVNYLKKKIAELKKRGVANVSYVAREGLCADEIISLARQTSDDLIAMCTHGRSGVRRWVLGSTTETVVRHSEDPVLIIPAKREVRSGVGSIFPEPDPEIRNALKYTID